MGISPESIAQVKNADIISIISAYVSLRKRGRNFIGLCPFHSEKTPSFTVSQEKKIWHCFGCHESGDLISFIQKVDNVIFTDAIRIIAEKSGIDIIEDQTKYVSKDNILIKNLQTILEKAKSTYQENLLVSQISINYLKKIRNINDDSIKAFELGFSPQNINLLAELKKTNSQHDDLIKSGLFYESHQGQLKDRFSGRLIFPILDYRGRTVGFGGRVIDDSNAPKYVNSEENILFNKRQLLYGLNIAKNSIKKQNKAFLMEGYLDVIVAHQFGFTNSIAVLGTALTANHLQLLKRFTDNIYLAFDSDDAGKKALERSYDILRKNKFNAYVISLSEKDPADFLIKYGADKFNHLIENAQPIFWFYYQLLKERTQLDSIENKSNLIDQVLKILKDENNQIIVEHYIHKISTDLNISPELILAKFSKTLYNNSVKFEKPSLDKKNKLEKAEEFIIYNMLMDLKVRQDVINKLNEESIFVEFNSVFKLLKNTNKTGTDLLDDIKDKELKNNLGRIIINNNNSITENDILNEINNNINAIRMEKDKQKIESIKLKLKTIEEKGNDDEIILLLKQIQTLKKRIGG